MSCSKWRIPVVVDVMPLKLSLFSMSFFAMKWAAILVCLGFQSWFSGSVYILYLALLNSCRHWLVNERPLTLNFSHFPNVVDCSNASPEARTVLSLFLFLFFLGQKVLSTEHKIRIVSKMCQRGPEGCPAACGLSSDGYLAGKFKFITKNRWISQLPLTSKCGYRK